MVCCSACYVCLLYFHVWVVLCCLFVYCLCSILLFWFSLYWYFDLSICCYLLCLLFIVSLLGFVSLGVLDGGFVLKDLG